MTQSGETNKMTYTNAQLAYASEIGVSIESLTIDDNGNILWPQVVAKFDRSRKDWTTGCAKWREVAKTHGTCIADGEVRACVELGLDRKDFIQDRYRVFSPTEWRRLCVNYHIQVDLKQKVRDFA